MKHIKKVKEGKDISDDDPFSRRRHGAAYWSMKTDGKTIKGATTTAAKRRNECCSSDEEAKKKKRMKKTGGKLQNDEGKTFILCITLKSHQLAQSKLLNSSNGMKPSLTHAKRATERDPVRSANSG